VAALLAAVIAREEAGKVRFHLVREASFRPVILSFQNMIARVKLMATKSIAAELWLASETLVSESAAV
jgi:hypothetical protein